MSNPSHRHLRWAEPSISVDDYAALKDCLDRKWISQGQKVTEFESLVAECAGRAFCVAAGSGSSALIAGLMASGVRHGTEVVVPALSFPGVANTVTMLGGVPVLADIDRLTGVITAQTVSPCISPDTVAVVGIDYSGFANDWLQVAGVCREHGIPLIVDAASSFLATHNGRPAGSFGRMTTFSFHAAKTIAVGEGGAIVTDDPALAAQLRRIRNHGEVAGRKYCCDVLGGNFKMTDLAASLGISQLLHKGAILQRRKEVIRTYLDNPWLRERALGGYLRPECSPNGFTFTLLCECRDRVMALLAEHGVEARAMWPLCVDQQPLYQDYPVRAVGDLRGARSFSHRCLSLPVHGGLTEHDIRFITKVTADVVGARDGGVL